MNKKIFLVILIVVLAISVSSGCLPKKETKQEREPIIITSYSSNVEMSLGELIEESDIIVRGWVGDSLPGRWNTSNGDLPSSVTVENLPSELYIFTDTQVQVSEILKGDYLDSVLYIRTEGGQVGQDQMFVPSQPLFTNGQEFVFFLVLDTAGTADSYTPEYHWYWILGTYEIVDQMAISEIGEEMLLVDLLEEIENGIQ